MTLFLLPIEAKIVLKPFVSYTKGSKQLSSVRTKDLWTFHLFGEKGRLENSTREKYYQNKDEGGYTQLKREVCNLLQLASVQVYEMNAEYVKQQVEQAFNKFKQLSFQQSEDPT